MNNSQKTLWMVSGGIQAVPAIRLAKQMGLFVVVSDMNPDAPGFALADDRVIADTYNVEATVAAAESYHKNKRALDGVICVASDVPLTVASVAHRLGLPGIPLESARLATNKLAMKQKFQRDGVAIPFFQEIDSVQQLREIYLEKGQTLVIKPIDSRGSRGVLRLGEGVDLDWAFDHARSQSPTGRVMVEAYLDGPQISTESIMLDGVAHTPGFSDRNYELLEVYAPHFIENGGELPSHIPAQQQEAVKVLVQQAALSMGIRNGVVKGDIVVHQGKPYVIELAARLSGGFFCTHEIPLNTGVDFVGAMIRLSLGLPVAPADLQPRFLRHIVQRYLFPKPGRIVAIDGEEVVRKLPGVLEVVVSAKVGDVIASPKNSGGSAAMVIATGDSREQAIQHAQHAIAQFRVVTQ